MHQDRIVEGDVDRLIEAFFFRDLTVPGIFVDVGAAGPDFLSVSSRFRERGWRVISVEANPEFCRQHRERGHEIYEFACGASDQDNVDFQVVNSQGRKYMGGDVSFESCSSLHIKPEYAADARGLEITNIKVSVRTLNTILREHARVEQFDILSVDVEGWELEVLQGLDLGRYAPKVLVIENLFAGAAYHAALEKVGYTLWQNIAPNDVYLRKPS